MAFSQATRLAGGRPECEPGVCATLQLASLTLSQQSREVVNNDTILQMGKLRLREVKH